MLQSEWKEETPMLYHILNAVATPRLAVEMNEDKLLLVCAAGSILFRSCNQHMPALATKSDRLLSMEEKNS